MSSFALALRQVRYENIAFWRNPVAAFFVFFFRSYSSCFSTCSSATARWSCRAER